MSGILFGTQIVSTKQQKKMYPEIMKKLAYIWHEKRDIGLK